jgi:integrase
VYAKTRKEAQERLRAALTAADHGIRPATGRLTVGDWLREWLTTSVETRNRPRTVASYRETVDRYIDPAIGRIPLTRLEPEDVAAMLRGLAARGLSPTTSRYTHAVLRIALGRAVKSGRNVRNVASLVEPPARRTAERRPLTAEQARAFLAATAGDRLEALYVLAITTGMRQGELLALRWQDLDLDAGRLSVRHTLRLDTRELAEPKTERARRTLRLGPDSIAALRDHRHRQLTERLAAGRRWNEADFVFASSIGTPMDSRNVTKAFQRILARVGLPHQRFHDLRHACATLLLEDGEELGVVSRILGHSQIATTADVYAHLTPAMLERSAARMDAILARRSEGATG